MQRIGVTRHAAAMRTSCGLAYRESGPRDGPAALLVHGYPESSYMWRDVLPALEAAGWHALAPDLAGFGDSEPDPPGTWERHVESIESFRRELGVGSCVPVVHDWGGLIGLRWACEHPQAVRGLVISSTGFFADGKWHGMADALRTPGTGEQVVETIDRFGFGGLLRSVSPSMSDDALDEYWKAYSDEPRRRGQLELYRSGDFEQLTRYDLAALEVPVLLVWGEKDEFAPPAGARRFERELAGAELVLIDGAGHFVWDDAPEACIEALTSFLARMAPSSGSST
jgi:haloalkane dehalogenase